MAGTMLYVLLVGEGQDLRRVSGGDPRPWHCGCLPTLILERVAPTGHPDSKRGSQLPVFRGPGGG